MRERGNWRTISMHSFPTRFDLVTTCEALFDPLAFIWWDGEQSKLSGTVLDACGSPVRTAYI
jgi:hypothetical protein